MKRAEWVSVLMGCAMLFGCGSAKSETLEDCKRRFKQNLPTRGPNFGKQQFDFTYQLSRDSNAFMQTHAKSARITISTGEVNQQTISEFTSGEVYPGGQFLSAKNVFLYRAPGPITDWDTAITTGCRNAPPGSSLYRVNAFPIAAPSGPG